MFMVFEKAKNLIFKRGERENMVRVQVELPAEEYGRLIEAVVKVHGRKRGVLSEFIREAIKKAVDEVLQQH